MKNICGDDNCLHCQAYMKPWHTRPPARNGLEANECAWLIESCMQDEKGPYYLCTRKFQHSTVFDWKPDNQAALRFSRKADAESARDAIRVFMPELFPHIVPMPKAVEHCWGIRATLPTAAGADTVCVKCDAEMLRVKACEHIAEGEEGWEKVRNVCPSTMAVAELRDAYEKLLAQQAGADKADEKDAERKSAHPCYRCGSMEVYIKEISDYPDYRITCRACEHIYWVDGPEALKPTPPAKGTL